MVDVKQWGIGSNMENNVFCDVVNMNYNQKMKYRSFLSKLIYIFSEWENIASFENSPNETAKVGEKIDYNSLTNFKDAILAYPEYYALIDGIIVDLSKEKFLARRVLYDRVKDIYKECKAESDDNNKIMTDMVSKLYEDYKDNELEVDGAILVDEWKYCIKQLIFYIFVQCEIFEKPPVL